MSAPRHVLMTADTVGGIWTYAMDLTGALTAAGVEVTLAVLGPEPSQAQHAEAEAVGATVETLGGALDWTAHSAGEVDFAGMRLAALAGRLRPDIVHLNNPALAAHARFPAPVLAVCHSCVKTWWSAVKGAAPLPDDLAWRAELTRRGYVAADALAAPTSSFAAATRLAHGLDETPRVATNGRAAPAAAASAPVHSVDGLGHFALTAGRLWDEGKGVATLDRAAARLHLRVHAAGPLEGPNGARIALRHVHPLGRLAPDALAARLHERPIFVSPALYEPFGLAVLEAAQAGCALVLSDIDSFRELWDGAAVFVPPGHDLMLAAAINALSYEPAQRLALGEAARRRAAQHSVEAMRDGVLGVYTELMAARDARRADVGGSAA